MKTKISKAEVNNLVKQLRSGAQIDKLAKVLTTGAEVDFLSIEGDRVFVRVYSDGGTRVSGCVGTICFENARETASYLSYFGFEVEKQYS
jgi:hypothetical protein